MNDKQIELLRTMAKDALKAYDDELTHDGEPEYPEWAYAIYCLLNAYCEQGKQLEAIGAGGVDGRQIMPSQVRFETEDGLPIELRCIAETVAEGGGFWRSCSGCHETNEGHPTGPYSKVFKCHLGVGCSECGGLGTVWDDTDYDAMADFMSNPQPASVPSDAGELPKETKWPLLKAMATNYKSGRHVWDGLDADACSSGAEEIRKLRALLAKYGNMQVADKEDAERWISVNERLPEINEWSKGSVAGISEPVLTVDISDPDNQSFQIQYLRKGGRGDLTTCYWEYDDSPTHWMPIPKLSAIDAARGQKEIK